MNTRVSYSCPPTRQSIETSALSLCTTPGEYTFARMLSPIYSRSLATKTCAVHATRLWWKASLRGNAGAYAVECPQNPAMVEGLEHDGSRHSAGDPLPPKCAVIEVHVAELKQLFNSIDPSPFRNRDLDPKAEEFIVGWAKDMPRDAQLALLVDLDRPAGLPNEAAVLRDAIHEFFHQRALAFWR